MDGFCVTYLHKMDGFCVTSVIRFFFKHFVESGIYNDIYFQKKMETYPNVHIFFHTHGNSFGCGTVRMCKSNMIYLNTRF